MIMANLSHVLQGEFVMKNINKLKNYIISLLVRKQLKANYIVMVQCVSKTV